MGLLERVAGTEMPEEKKSDFPDIPENKWLLLESAPEDDEFGAPSYNDEHWSLGFGTKILGGEPTVNLDYWGNRFGPRVSMFAHETEWTEQDGKRVPNKTDKMDGKFLGFLNTLFSPDLPSGSDERRQNTFKVLDEAAGSAGLDDEMFPDAVAMTVAAAAMALKSGQRKFLAKFRKKGKYTNIVQFEDATAENLQRLGIVEVPEDDIPF